MSRVYSLVAHEQHLVLNQRRAQGLVVFCGHRFAQVQAVDFCAQCGRQWRNFQHGRGSRSVAQASIDQRSLVSSPARVIAGVGSFCRLAGLGGYAICSALIASLSGLSQTAPIKTLSGPANPRIHMCFRDRPQRHPAGNTSRRTELYIRSTPAGEASDPLTARCAGVVVGKQPVLASEATGFCNGETA